MNSIRRITDCRREIEEALLIVAVPRVSRPGHDPGSSQRLRMRDSRKNKEYERKMLTIKERLRQALNDLVHESRNYAIYDSIAYDLMKVFHSILSRYTIQASNLYYGIRCIVIPVIWAILDEDHLGFDAYNRQQTRKHLLKKLLIVEVVEHDRQESMESNSHSDIHSVEGGSSRNSSDGNSKENRYTRVHKPSRITLEVLDTLFNALGKLAAILNNDDFRIRAHIFHIMNITYIFEILSEYIHVLRSHVENDLQRVIVTSNLLFDAFGKYERDIQRYLEEFNLDCPMSIFREQLYNLYFEIMILKPLLKK